jgi:general secretion pathway protein F
MPRYVYRAYDQRGVLKQGTLDTQSREAAIDALHRQGHYPLDVTEGGAAPTQRWWEREVFGGGHLSLQGLSLFTHELASLVKADLPLDEALRIVSLQPLMSAKIRRVTKNVLDGVREGNSLSGALAGSGADFPEYYWRLVQAGEAGGSIGDVLEDISGFLERSIEVRGQIGSALIYPAILLAGAGAALVIIMAVLLPTLLPLFKDADAALPPTIKYLVNIQAALEQNWIAIPIVFAGIMAAAIAIRQYEPFRLMYHRALLRLPVAGGIVANRETARFARTLATLSRNGVAMLDAVRLSGSVLRNRAFAAAISAAGDSLQEGSTISAPLLQSGLFSELSLRLIAVGEQAGQLDAMLMRVAIIYETMVQRQLARLTSLITPVLTLLIGGLVGGLILSVMSAILGVNTLAFE